MLFNLYRRPRNSILPHAYWRTIERLACVRAAWLGLKINYLHFGIHDVRAN